MALGERAGRPVRTLGGEPEPRPRKRPRLCAASQGFDVHAGRVVAKGDREGLERLCRYGLRGPLANGRLERLPDGRLLYDLKRPLPNGATHLYLEPLELSEKLAALIPPSRQHLTVYSGVFAAHARLRRRIVPAGGRVDPLERLRRRRAWGRWAELMKRVFKVDLLVCPACAGERRILEALYESDAVERILKAHGESTAALPRAPVRDPPQRRLWGSARGEGADEYAHFVPPDDFNYSHHTAA